MNRFERSAPGRRPPMCGRLATARLLGGVLLSFLLCGGGEVQAASPPVYTITDLGTLGTTDGYVNAINNRGEVVGLSRTLADVQHAFRFDATGMHDLGTLGGPSSEARGINDSGQVVGGAARVGDDLGHGHAFLASGGVMQDLGTLGGSQSWALGINASGQVVGWSKMPTAGGTPPEHAFLYDGTGMHDLGTLPGYPCSMAVDINTAGVVVGYAHTIEYEGPSPFHAFLYDGAGMHDLGTLGGKASSASAINDAGQVVGGSKRAGNTVVDELPEHAFLYDNTGMHDLGTLGGNTSDAIDINAGGQVVGRSELGAIGQTHAFLYSDGIMQDLNDLLLAGGSWELVEARAINDRGQIAGIGRIGTQRHLFLLTPDPNAQPVPPQKPIGLTVRMASLNQLDLTWTDKSNNERSFEIERRRIWDDWRNVATVLPNATTFQDPFVGRYSHYMYRVRAVNKTGASAWSDVASGDTGVGARASIGWSDRDFGTVPLGTSSDPQKMTITNAGTGPLVLGSITVEGANPEEFAISRRVDTIAPGETDFISIVFTPTALGNRSARLTITSNSTDIVGEIRMTGSGAPPLIPSISTNPSSLSFGDQLVGTTNGSQAILLQNTGQTLVEVRQVSIEGTNPGDFAITADGATGLELLPGRTCLVNVRFLPTTAGPRSANLTITDTAVGSPHLVPLSGTGLAPAVRLSSSSLAFGEQPVGTASGAQNVTITNTGTAPLTIPAVTLAGDNPAEFTIGTSVSGVTLAPGESRTLEVRFAPSRPGSRRATLVISDNAPGSPHLVTLSGTGTAPSVTFGISRLERPTRVSFGEQPVGSSSAAQTLTVTNSGAAPLTISSVRITGANAADFALNTDSGGPVLAPGASRSFTLSFRPVGGGSRSASLTMSDNAVGSPHTVALQGMGVMIPPPAPAGLELKMVSFKEIQLTWVPGSPETTSYAIWRKVGEGEFERCGGVSGMLNRFVDRHVSPNTTYTYRVRANGPGGVSGWSEEVGGTTPHAPPVAPTVLTVRVVSASQLELRWTDNSNDETSFALWRQSGAGEWARIGGVSGNVTQVIDRKLTPSTTYTYRVRANGPGGISGWSNEAAGTTPPAAPAPTSGQK